MNRLVKWRFRKAFGFWTFAAMEVALDPQLGQLPESKLARKFCRGSKNTCQAVMHAIAGG